MGEGRKLDRCIRLLEALTRQGPLANRGIRKLLGVDRRTALRDLRSLEQARTDSPLEASKTSTWSRSPEWASTAKWA